MRAATAPAAGELIQIGATEYAVEESINEQTGDPQGWLLLNLTSGAVYEVRAGPQPTCTCPDYICRKKQQTGETCKHVDWFFPPEPELEEIEVCQGPYPEPAPLEVGDWSKPEPVERAWQPTPPNRVAESLFIRILSRPDVDPLALSDDEARRIADRCLWLAGLFEVQEERFWEVAETTPVRLREECSS